MSDYSFTDRNGDLWINASQVREEGRFEVRPIEPYGPSELGLSLTELLYTKGHPTVQLVLDEETHNQLAKMETTK